jgi:mRNA-degrading endonuclease RelE of RelBE toxin-antitoxin system
MTANFTMWTLALTGPLGDLWRYRVGDLRIIAGG